MSLRHVIVELPDRPGSLGQVTTLLGRLGVDIRQMRVLSRDGAVATDEFVVNVPGAVIDRTLPELLEEIQGVRVLAIAATDTDSGIAGAIVAV
ncbi:ACT domain-containing protein [Dactylosporangium sp. CA-139066]|uniref:ACT domain-containing protein n=1 Tax=Dactylosporangium sp. CA-139066 TaxID=3239930 RepID=UPI003D8F1E66